MNHKIHPQPEPAEPSQPSDWVATVKGLQQRIPALGSTSAINILLVRKDGIPHRHLGGRVLFNVPEVLAWMSKNPGRNLPQAS